jgi:aminoglycoside phosphotransferase family enzyme
MSVEQGVKSACIPCGLGHVSTSSVLLNEAMRFKKDGLSSPQVLDDVAQAIGEFNALERIDLTPAKIAVLPDWEKEMAESVSEKSRELRHRLEIVQDMDELEQIAVETEDFFKYLNREWISKRVGKCPTCQINNEEANIEEAESEVEPEGITVEEEPKSKLSEYGRKASEARQRLLIEIREARKR